MSTDYALCGDCGELVRVDQTHDCAGEEDDDLPWTCTCGACSCLSRENLDALGICADCRRGVHDNY